MKATKALLLTLAATLTLTGCSLPYRMTHGDGESRDAADTEYQALPAAEQAEVQKELTEIAKTDKDYDVRKAAVERLTDQALLIEIAKTDEDAWVHRAAVWGLSDQAVLAEVAKTDEHSSVRKTAVWGLTDQAVLVEVAKTDKDFLVREAAVWKLTDQAALAEIAKTDEDPNVRLAAVEKLTLETCRIYYNECLERSQMASRNHLVVEGLYAGMPHFDFVVITKVKGLTVDCSNDEGIIKRLTFDRHQRYKLTQLDDNNFCGNFLGKYADLDSSSWKGDYDDGKTWRIWTSTKYSVKVSYCENNGTLILETY